MRRIGIHCLVCLMAAASHPLAAQTLGLPSYYSEVMSGYGVAVDAGADTAGFRTIGLTGIVALGHLTIDSVRLPLFNVSATGALLTGSGTHAGGSAVGLEVSVLASFKVGVDRSRWDGVSRLHLPLAAAVPVLQCANAKRIFALYGVPVWNFERVQNPTGWSWQSSWGSASLDAALDLHSGLGFQIGVERPFSHTTRDPYRRLVIGAGVSFTPHGVLRERAPGKGGCAFGL